MPKEKRAAALKIAQYVTTMLELKGLDGITVSSTDGMASVTCRSMTIRELARCTLEEVWPGRIESSERVDGGVTLYVLRCYAPDKTKGAVSHADHIQPIQEGTGK